MSHIPGPECADCLRRLALDTLDRCGLDGAARARLQTQGEAILAQGLEQAWPPAIIANRFLALVRRYRPTKDPMAAKKAADLAAARRAVRELGPVPDTLEARVRAAIIGNSLDHFLVARPEEFWGRGLDFGLGIDHLARAASYLVPGAGIVILADNTGEQCFDRLLVEHLLGRGCRVTYVVKSRPVQNDLTLEDLRAHGEDYGLGRVVGSGTAQVGLDPEAIPGPLARRLQQADLVVAKGMGHYETLRRTAGLDGGGPSPWPLLFLFLAKCRPVARSLGVELGAAVAALAP